MAKAQIDYTVGDYVQRKPANRFGIFTRQPGPFRVVEILPIGVRFDNPPKGMKLSARWTPRFFEKVAAPVAPASATKGEYILILREDDKLKPNINPRTYSSEAQAKAVAHEMAEKYPGNEFLIFKAVGMSKAVASTVVMF